MTGAMTGAEMRAIRLKLGLMQKELALELGYRHESRISELERGRKPITARTARTLHLIVANRQAAPWLEKSPA